MIGGLLLVIASMAGFVAGIVGVKLLFQPASGLRLNIFRPWRGDPWPRGVQEDYDTRFDWSAAKRHRRPVAPSWGDIVITPTAEATNADTAEITLEELPGGAVVVEQLGPVSIHHVPPH